MTDPTAFIRRQWGRAAHVYDEVVAPALSDAHRAILARVGEIEGCDLLDLGCGTGRVAALAAERGARVTAVDLSPEMVQRARSLSVLSGARIEVMDAQELDLPDASFDVVVASFSVMFCPRPEEALAEARRVLRPGGRFAAGVWSIAEECEHTSVSAVAIAAAGGEGVAPDVPTGQSLADPERLRTAMQGAGFSGIELAKRRFSLRYPGADALWEAIAEIYAELLPEAGRDAARAAALAEIARIGLPLRSWAWLASARA
jgi:SAM-dependent methyltransferase